MSAPVAHEEIFTLLQIARFGACATRTDGTVVFWNRRAEQIAGVPASQAIGRRYGDLVGSAAGRLSSADASEHEASGNSPVVLAGQPGDPLVLHVFDDFRSAPTAAPPTTAGSIPEMAPAPLNPPDLHGLTQREIQILQLMAAGTASDQMAADLDISVHTVHNHIRNLRRKLDARTKMEAVAIAFRQGLL